MAIGLAFLYLYLGPPDAMRIVKTREPGNMRH